MSACDSIAGILKGWYLGAMRYAWVSLLLLANCSASQREECVEEFCTSRGAKLLGKQEIADFNLYQLEWSGESIAIYVGDFPDFDGRSTETIEIPIDANAKLVIDGQQGQILAHLSDDWPKFLHLTGPCASRDDCLVVEAANALTHPR